MKTVTVRAFHGKIRDRNKGKLTLPVIFESDRFYVVDTGKYKTAVWKDEMRINFREWGDR